MELNLESLALDVFEWLGCREEQTRPIIVQALKDIKLFDKKHHDYGAGNISKFGEFGVLIRVNDKLERIINLRRLDQEPANESIDDAWQDMGVYSMIARVIREGKWL